MIRVKYRFLFGAILAGSLASQALAQQGVPWQPTLDSAKRLAGQTNRLVLVHFWAEWCKPCAQMERDVFSRADVAGTIQSNFVPVKVNVDHFPATVREYGVSIVPTDVVITADGQLVDKLIGMPDAAQYAGRLSQIAQSRSPQSDAGSQMAASAPPAGSYQQPAAGAYATPAQPAAQSPAQASAPSDDRYANYFAQQKQPEPSSAASPYANQWTPPAASPSAAATAGQAPSQQIPTSPYQSEASSPYSDPSARRNSASPYRSDAASPYGNAAKPAAPSSPYAMDAAPPYGSNAASPYQTPAAPSNDSLATSPYQSPATPPYQSGATSPYQNPAASQASPYQNPTASPASPYQSPAASTQDVAASSPYQSRSPYSRQDASAPDQSKPWAKQASPAEETPLADKLPPGSPPLALDGFCPVRLAEQEKWVKGDARWGARHDGRTYLFAGPEEQQKFLASPEQYAPALSGNDIVLAVEQKQMVPGHREHGVWYHGKVYLFSDEASCQRFNAAPDQYVAALEQNAGGMARRPAGASSTGSAWQTYGSPGGGPY